MKNRKKKGQVQIQFNWIFILIAGAVILLFFVGLVVKQKGVAEQGIRTEILTALKPIITAEAFSEKTKIVVEVPDEEVFFHCTDDVSNYGIQKAGVAIDTPITPIFAPESIMTTKMVSWSLPYQMPYKVMDLLIVSAINNKYYVLGDETKFRTELINFTEEFNFDEINSGEYTSLDPGDNFRIRMVVFGSTNNVFTENGGVIPKKLAAMGKKLSGVLIDKKETINGATLTFYENEYSSIGNSGTWVSNGEIDTIGFSSMGAKDSVLYGAVFAESKDSFECNMIKVFTRMNLLNKVYEKKMKTVEEHFGNTGNNDCTKFLEQLGGAGIDSFMADLQDKVGTCVSALKVCDVLGSGEWGAKKLQSTNQGLLGQGCMRIY
ncbi:hypothetical protein HOC13_02870 [Candidatus Woesearchaeota archaeon]|jgi:hypothetical protein|nr:hypothetical protein [Candidatus Woesearchaeota archaeon]